MLCLHYVPGGDCLTMWGNGVNKHSSLWLPWSQGQTFKQSNKLAMAAMAGLTYMCHEWNGENQTKRDRM